MVLAAGAHQAVLHAQRARERLPVHVRLTFDIAGAAAAAAAAGAGGGSIGGSSGIHESCSQSEKI